MLWPWITWRLARSRQAAPAPSVFVHAAPISLVTLAFFSVAGSLQGHPTLESPLKPIGQMLFGLSTVGGVVTLAFGWLRRSTLREFVRPSAELWVHQEWAALTFPLVATSTVAFLFCSRATGTTWAITIWPTTLGFVCLFVLLAIDVLFFLRLPVWLARGLPPVPVPPPRMELPVAVQLDVPVAKEVAAQERARPSLEIVVNASPLPGRAPPAAVEEGPPRERV